MKGITPIISIIILLLITIGLASAAWTYMSVYLSSMMDRQLQVFPPDCIGGTTPSFTVRNSGTGNVGINDIYMRDVNSGGNVGLDWEDLSGAAMAAGSVIGPGENAIATVQPGDECTVAGVQATCKYSFTVSGSNFKQDVTVVCTG